MALSLVLTVTTAAFGSGRGIAIEPDAEGNFEYVDDFSTARFLKDAFLRNLTIDSWRRGEITNAGPHGNRTLTYRFYSDRLIAKIDVRVDQVANSRHLGASNSLYLSVNGLDWSLVASSEGQEADHNGWQQGPLAVPPDRAAKFVPNSEVWVRVVLDNTSGGKTNTSNRVRRIAVMLEVGGKARAAGDPQAARRAAWGQLRRKTDWKGITLDWTDPIDERPPHYYEDTDGLLQAPGANPHLDPDETEGFPVQFTYLSRARSPLSLAVFVETNGTARNLMAKITVRSTRESSRKMNVLWDGKALGTFDTASFFETEKDFLVACPGPQPAGVHELRIAGGDTRCILIRTIAVVGDGAPRWVERPKLPGGGSLEVLSAYYMPDPKPPPDSQAIQEHLLRLYKEHADLGGLRVVVRNNGDVPVRIDNTLLLNDQPIEESYVEFGQAWDARGVVWYRVRPRLLQPGQCGQLYIRFRRRPAGRFATITIPLENGRPVSAKVPYEAPGLSIDYATTGKAMKTLYVYARRSAGARPGKVVGLRLDGNPIKDAKIYGAGFGGNVVLAVGKLAEPLRAYKHHVVGLETGAGKAVDAQFRVLPFFFPRSSIDVPLKLMKQQHMNLAMWWDRGLEQCEKYDTITTRTWRENIMEIHRRVAYYIGLDEPDGQDNRWGRFGKGLGHYAREVAETGWQEILERNSPRVASWIMTAKSSRPLNWAVYGQLADVFSTDPYPINESAPQADHTFTRECLLIARRCSTPHRFYATLEAWRDSDPARRGRFPLPAEYRQSVVQAIGCGMKGLTSWVYRDIEGGWQRNEALGREISKVNALIEHIEGDLLIGTPIDLAASDAGLAPAGPVGDEKWRKDRVWVSSLLCGPDTIVVAAANHIRASKPEPPTIEPATDVTITVQLPEFLQQVKGFEATEDGVVPFAACTVAGGKAMVKLAVIESGRVFVLRRR